MCKPLRSIAFIIILLTLATLGLQVAQATAPAAGHRSRSVNDAPTAVSFSALGAEAMASRVFAAQTGSSICSTAPNLITWTTATEVNTAGFNLYRAESADGPYTKINDELIPAARDSLSGSQYEFSDANVIAGKTFYYQLEDVEFSGRTTRHGPITVTAHASIWLCENPIVSVAIAVALLAALGLILAWARRRAKPALRAV